MSFVKALEEEHNIPVLEVHDAAAALEWYKKVFDGRETMRMPRGDRLLHSEIKIGNNTFFVKDSFPEFDGKVQTPVALNGTPVKFHFRVKTPDELDAFYRRAEEAGATSVMGAEDQFWGDRHVAFRDPFGHNWAFVAKLDAKRAEAAKKKWEANKASTGAGAKKRAADDDGKTKDEPASKRAKKSIRTTADKEEWLRARKALLIKEKAATYNLDALAAQRRQLPWLLVDKDYEFEDRNGNTLKLSELITANGHSSLVIYHFMFDDTYKRPCASCSYFVDSQSGAIKHFQQKANFAVVVKAGKEKLNELLNAKTGWDDFPVLSSAKTTFNRDFDAEYTPEEVASKKKLANYGSQPAMGQTPGCSVFKMHDDGKVYHTYSAYNRGLDIWNGCYQLQDFLPDGRNEEELPWTMSWVKHKEDY